MSFLLPCPRLFAIDAISNALTAQQCRNREHFGWWQSGRRGKPPPDAAGRARGNVTHEPAPLFRTNFRISRNAFQPGLPGAADRGDIGLSQRNPAFTTQQLRI